MRNKSIFIFVLALFIIMLIPVTTMGELGVFDEANRFASLSAVDKTTVVADGSSTAKFTVYIYDAEGDIAGAGEYVYFSSTRGAGDKFTDADGLELTPIAGNVYRLQTDANGKVIFRAKSTIVGCARIGVGLLLGETGTTDLYSYLTGTATSADCGFINSYDITFTAPPAESIEIKTAPTKLTYRYGEPLYISGGIITVTESITGATSDIVLSADMVSGYNCTVLGSQTLTITYAGKATTFDVFVEDYTASIAIKNAPIKLTYKYGETLDLTGGTIIVTKASEATEDIPLTADMVSGFSSTTPGSQTLTVTYDGRTTQYHITVEVLDAAEYVVMFVDANGYVQDGQVKDTDVAPFVHDSRTVVSIKPVAEAFGCDTEWNEVTQTLTLTRSDMSLTVVVGSPTITKGANGVTTTYEADIPAFIKNGQVVLPFRATAEMLGLSVCYDASVQAVTFSQRVPYTVAEGYMTVFVGSTGYVHDGKAKATDVAPFIHDECVFVAVRPIADAFGCEIGWNEAAQTITLTRNDITLAIEIGSNTMTKTVDGITTDYIADVPAFIKDGRTVLPLCAVGEAMGANATWYPDAKAITLTSLDSSSGIFDRANRFASVSAVDKTTVVANGSSTAKFTVYVYDAENDIAGAGEYVYFSSTRSASDRFTDDDGLELTPIAGKVYRLQTDATGKVIFRAKSTITGTTNVGISILLSDIGTTDLYSYLTAVPTATAATCGFINSYNITFTASPAESIEIKTAPTKLTYRYGEPLDVTGGVITVTAAITGATYDVPLTTNMVSGYNSTTLGNQTLIVTYDGKTAAFEVIVEDYTASIAIKKTPDKLIYKYGETLDVTGGIITVTKASGVTEDFSLTPDMISGFNSSIAGRQTLTVTYDETATTYTVTIASANVGGGGGGGSPISTAPPVSSSPLTKPITTGNKELDKSLKEKGKAIIDLSKHDNSSVEISPSTLQSLADNDKQLNIQGNGIQLILPPKIDSDVLPSLKANQFVQIGARSISKDEKQVILDNAALGDSTGLFEIGGKIFDLTAQISTSNAEYNSTSRITGFSEPVEVTIDLSDLDLSAEQISNLSGVRLEKNCKGQIIPVMLGGTYNSTNKTFTFFTERFSYYTVLQNKDVLKVDFFINSKVSVINGVVKVMDVPPRIVNNRTMVPLRFIGEALNASFDWEETTRTVTFELEEKKIKLIVDQQRPGLDTPPTIVEGRTMVPIRYISQAFGAHAVWFPSTKKVCIIK